MGRIKTMLVKRVSNELLIRYKDRLTSNFSTNKQKLVDIVDVKNKKLRNILAGCLTKKVKNANKAK